MNAWEVVFSALLGIAIGGLFWFLVCVVTRECTRRARNGTGYPFDPQDRPRDAVTIQRPPPICTRPPPGTAVVQQPCDTLSLARVV